MLTAELVNQKQLQKQKGKQLLFERSVIHSFLVGFGKVQHQVFNFRILGRYAFKVTSKRHTLLHTKKNIAKNSYAS